MFDDIKSIKSAISSFRNETTFLELRNRWQDDFSLYRLCPYNAGEGYYSYTSNYPRILADKIISYLTGSSLFIRVPGESLKEEERRIASNVERFLYGALNLNDERLDVLGLPPLRDQLAFYLVVRGACCVRIFVHKNETGKTIPAIDVWDIYNVAYGQSKDGLSWATHTRKATKEQIEDEYGVDIKGGKSELVDVIDYWDKEKYGVIVKNEWAQDLESHGLKYNPVFLLRSGVLPPIWQDDYQYTGAHQGESVFSAIRNIIPLFNKTLSDHLTMVRRGVKPPMGYWSSGGKEFPGEGDIFQVEKAAIIPLDINDKLEPILPPSMPADTSQLLQVISGELQRGGVPHTSFGQLGFRLSGYAISQLHAALEGILTPFLGTANRGYALMCRCLIQQFVDKKLPPIYVKGRTSRNEAFGMPKEQKIKPSDLKGDWHPEVKLEPILPKDDAENYYLANLARQGEVPLLSDRTIREVHLGVEDVDLEDEKIDQEWAAKLPIPRLYDAYLAALQDGRPDKAENYLAELRQALAQLGRGRTAPRQGATPTRRETGLPSQVMPSEGLGGEPPGAQGAKMPLEGSA